MDDDKIKEQDSGAAGKQRTSSPEAKETAEVRSEETETDSAKTTQQSQVYTATRDTLFPKTIPHSRTHALVGLMLSVYVYRKISTVCAPTFCIRTQERL